MMSAEEVKKRGERVDERHLGDSLKTGLLEEGLFWVEVVIAVLKGVPFASLRRRVAWWAESSACPHSHHEPSMIHWLLLLWLRLSHGEQFPPRPIFPLDIVVGLPTTEGSKAKNPFLLTLGKSQPVFDVAVEDVTEKHQLLPRNGLRITYEDTALSDSLGPQRIIQHYCDRTVDAVMGIAYVYGLAPIARMSTYWYSGVPVFTTTALVDELGDRNFFPLLTRMMGSYRSLAHLVKEMSKTFHWRHFHFLFNDEAVHGGGVGRSECYFSLVTIKNLIQKQKDVVWNVEMFSEFTAKRMDYHTMLQKASLLSNRMFPCYLSAFDCCSNYQRRAIEETRLGRRRQFA